MKNLKIFLLFVLIANSFWSCEKDDICEAGTATTPRLIIEFYDNEVVINKKTVTNLVVDTDTEVGILKFSGVSKIEIPLKTSAIVTEYNFRLTTGETIPTAINSDKISINYTKSDTYISRACGFKTVFKLKPTNGFDLISDANNWIKSYVVEKPNVLNENETHVKIYF